ncbi:hypothetical protein CE206_28800 (plasmid) [Achromobacter xylosoxidans]|nr:hypothetical protein CE206_28800 [Achromobacter xylosoxidans]
MHPMKRIVSGVMTVVLLASCASVPGAQRPPPNDQGRAHNVKEPATFGAADGSAVPGASIVRHPQEKGGPAAAPTLPWNPAPATSSPAATGHQAASAHARSAGDFDGSILDGSVDPRKAPGSSSDFSSWAEGRATGMATGAAQAWLSQYGTAKLSLQRHGGALDLLVPLAESEKGTFFTQLGVRRTNQLTDSYRTTLNLGLGYRYMASDDVMVGANAFIDANPDRGHRRLGLGGEVWTDYLKFSANGYFQQSAWKESPDLDSYMERPASGFDVRLEGYLPQYPQLGAKVMYEKYYGDEVGLFGQNDRQRNPSAWTLGATYTPVPALSIGVERRFGQGGLTDTAFKVGLKYALGVPLARQFDASEVGATRKVSTMRHDLVERNNEIVLEYKKVVSASIRLPESLSGYSGAVVPFSVGVAGVAAGAYSVQWGGTASAFVTAVSAANEATLTFPQFVSGGVNSYTLTATLVDSKGAKVTSNVMTVVVNPLTVVLQASKPVAKADGVDSIRFIASVKGVLGEAVSGQLVRWNVSGVGAIREQSDQTDASGQAFAVVASAAVGQAAVQARVGDAFEASAAGSFATNLVMISSLTVNPTSLIADGASKGSLTATVVDGAGKPVPAGVDVLWQADVGTLAAGVSKTDAKGTATNTITAPTAAGQSTVVARVAGAPDQQLVVPIIPDAGGARVGQIVASKQQANADGSDSITFTATVQDTHGNLVGAGVTVAWSTNLGTLVSPTSLTNAQSKASTVVIAPQTVGTARVTARASQADPGESSDVSFKLDPADARVASLVPDKADGWANGTDTITMTATVEDLRGNSVGSGIQVTWSSNLPSLDGRTSITDAGGRATLVISAPIVPTVVNVSAKAAPLDSGQSTAVNFRLDPTMYRVRDLTADKYTGAADSVDQANLRALVTDASGAPVGAGVSVTWVSTGGYLGRATSTTDASGYATNTLRSAWSTNFTVTAKATRAGGADSGRQVTVTFLGATLSFSIDKANIASSGIDGGTGTVNVALTNGEPYSGDIRVSMGPLLRDELNRTQFVVRSNAAGQASFRYFSDEAQGGTGSVRVGLVTWPGVGDTLGVEVIAPKLTNVWANSAAGNPSDGVTGVSLFAEVRHFDGTPAVNHPVSWTTSLGTFVPPIAQTNAQGQAVSMLFSTIPGQAMVSVSAKGDLVVKYLNVQFDP